MVMLCATVEHWMRGEKPLIGLHDLQPAIRAAVRPQCQPQAIVYRPGGLPKTRTTMVQRNLLAKACSALTVSNLHLGAFNGPVGASECPFDGARRGRISVYAGGPAVLATKVVPVKLKPDVVEATRVRFARLRTVSAMVGIPALQRHLIAAP